MKISRLPATCFAVAFALAASASAVAASHWNRVVYGIGSGAYGGGPGQYYGAIGCELNPLSMNAYCPIVDNDTITSYAQAGVYFTNANQTQPALACVTYYNQNGGTCSSTSVNNCPSGGGACSFNMNISAWQNDGGDFKYIEFKNLTVGALLAGYVLYYNTL